MLDARPSQLIDFHSHFVHPSWTLTTAVGQPAARRAQWEKINALITDEGALLAAIDEGDLSARVVNTPTAFIADADGNVEADAYRRINDQLADLVSRNAGRLYGLATVDTFGGDGAARELRRAIVELGLRGVFLESARGDLLLDARQARPVLATAAELGIPVFAHPVNPEPLSGQMAPYGRLGTLFARGTVNAATLIALIESGAFVELPELKVVVTALSIGGILLAASFGDHSTVNADVGAVLRRNVYVETMGFNPTLIRAAVEVLGVDHVVAGSDWPIVNAGPIRTRAQAAFEAAGLSAGEQQQVSGGNAEALLSTPPALTFSHSASTELTPL